jgi:signal transduction histidine kinase
MRRTIVTRVLVLAVVTGLAGAAISTITSWRLIRDGVSRGFAEILIAQYDPAEVSRCHSDPSHWQLTISTDAHAFAYDETTLRSSNPAAPALRADLYAKLPPGDDQYVVGFNRRGRGVAIVLRRHSAAPCGLVQLISEPALSLGQILTTKAAGALLSGFVCCFAAVLIIGIPLVRRIRRLRAGAAKLGDPDYAPYDVRRDGNELDDLAGALDAAHARIRADAALLEHQRNALERHLVEIAHDLRTPLTSLQAALERATDTTNAGIRAELLTGALFDVVYLSALTDNLRLASELRDGEGRRLDTTALDVGELVERIAARARMLARRRNVSLEMAGPDTPLVVRASAVATEQALTNIIQNAVTYVDDGGRVAIVVRGDDECGTFTIDVRDDGPGVPPTELPRLGTGTFRSDEARQRDPRGRGIGLAITAEVCRRFGWTLSFHGLEPRGLDVRIEGPTTGDREN